MPALSAGIPFSTLSIRGGWVHTTENPKPDLAGRDNLLVCVNGVLKIQTIILIVESLSIDCFLNMLIA